MHSTFYIKNKCNDRGFRPYKKQWHLRGKWYPTWKREDNFVEIVSVLLSSLLFHWCRDTGSTNWKPQAVGVLNIPRIWSQGKLIWVSCYSYTDGWNTRKVVQLFSDFVPKCVRFARDCVCMHLGFIKMSYLDLYTINNKVKVKVKVGLFVTYTIIQSTISSEMQGFFEENTANMRRERRKKITPRLCSLGSTVWEQEKHLSNKST